MRLVVLVVRVSARCDATSAQNSHQEYDCQYKTVTGNMTVSTRQSRGTLRLVLLVVRVSARCDATLLAFSIARTRVVPAELVSPALRPPGADV